jgi:ABC-type transport system involved in multi-copper enzyme maturation permease subunit
MSQLLGGIYKEVPPELTIIAVSLWLIVFLGLTAVVYLLVSIWKENGFGWPLRGIFWFTVAIIGSLAVIGLLAGYDQTASSLEKSPTSYRYERKRIVREIGRRPGAILSANRTLTSWDSRWILQPNLI